MPRPGDSQVVSEGKLTVLRVPWNVHDGTGSIGSERSGLSLTNGNRHMRDVEVRDLFDLASGEVDDPHEKLSQLYQWIYDYSMTGTKALTAFGASFLIAITVAVIQESHHQIGPYVIAGFSGSGLTLLVGFIRYLQLRGLSKQYLAAHVLLSEVSQIRSFLTLYKNSQRP